MGVENVSLTGGDLGDFSSDLIRGMGQDPSNHNSTKLIAVSIPCPVHNIHS